MITLDPLSPYADPRLYVPLKSGERVLAAVEASLRAGHSPVLLTGPAGIGKTLLLTVVADRERGSRSSVRFARSLEHGPEALCNWLLRFLFGESAADGGDAELALLEKLRTIRDEPILLLVDQIHLAPIASIRKLADLARAAAPGLELVVCGSEGDSAAVAEALAPYITLSLPEALPDLEIEALYDAILAHAGLSPRLRHRLESVPRMKILRAAAGRPGFLKAELVRRDQPRFTRAQPLPVPLCVPPPPVEPKEEVRPTLLPAERRPPARARLRNVADRPLRVVRAAGRASTALLALPFHGLAYLARAPGAIGSAARSRAGAMGRAAAALLHAAADSFADSATRLRDAVAAAGRGTVQSIQRGHASLLRMRAQIGSATADAARTALRVSVAPIGSAASAIQRGHASSSRMRAKISSATVDAARHALRASVASTGSAAAAIRHTRAALLTGAHEQAARVSSALAGARRRALAGVRRRSGELARAAEEAANRARLGTARSLARTRDSGATILARSRARAVREATLLRATTRDASLRCVATAARAGRTVLRAAPAAALPATAILAIAVFSLSDRESRGRSDAPGVVSESPASYPVRVQVNARPWATVRIDGVDLGATPLSHRLPPGVYKLEAEFPDGKRIERKIDVRPESRFVSLP